MIWSIFPFAYFVASVIFLPSSYFIYAYFLDEFFLISYPYPQICISNFSSLPLLSRTPDRLFKIMLLFRKCIIQQLGPK